MNYKDAIVRRFTQLILANGPAFSNAKHFFYLFKAIVIVKVCSVQYYYN